MTDNSLTLFCLVDGQSTSTAFPISISSAETVEELKELITIERAPRFDDAATDELTLWRVFILDDDNDDAADILLDNLPEKKKLRATSEFSHVFKETPSKKTIYILVQRLRQVMRSRFAFANALLMR